MTDMTAPNTPPADGLKNCPFCGGDRARTINIRDGRKVACICGACGSPEFHGALDRPSAEARAIAAWNTRATPAPDAAIREALADKDVVELYVFLSAYADEPDGDLVNRVDNDNLLTWGILRRLYAALAQQPQVVPDGWRTIDSAPKDGTEFQGWVSWGGRDGWWEPKCRFNADTEAFEVWGRVDYDQDGWDSHAVTVSYWIPTPAAPVSGRAG